MGAAGVRGIGEWPAWLHRTIFTFGLTRPITEDHDGDCTDQGDQGVSVLTLFILFLFPP